MAGRATSHPAASPVGDSSFAEIRSLAASLHDLHRQKAAALAPTVQNLLDARSHDVREIEHTLDHLLDCACIPEGLVLFKSLCRHYYGINPASTTTYVHAYRDMWDTEADQEKGMPHENRRGNNAVPRR